jgi:hypothetical protein
LRHLRADELETLGDEVRGFMAEGSFAMRVIGDSFRIEAVLDADAPQSLQI